MSAEGNTGAMKSMSRNWFTILLGIRNWGWRGNGNGFPLRFLFHFLASNFGGVSPQQPPGFAKGFGFSQVLEDVRPFVNHKGERVVTINILGYPIDGLFLLLLKGAKHAIPNDESGTVILVDVLGVGRLMDTMMRGRHHEVFYRGGQLTDVLRMNPKLIQHTELVDDEKNKRIKSHHNHRQEENNLDGLGPAQPKSNRVIVLTGVVVGNVGGPPKPLFVTNPVGHITNKIQGKQAKNVRPPSRRNAKRREIVNCNAFWK